MSGSDKMVQPTRHERLARTLSQAIVSGQRAHPISLVLFFLVGYLSFLFDTDRSRTLADLDNHIPAAIYDVPIGMLDKIEIKFKTRLLRYIDQSGHHLMI